MMCYSHKWKERRRTYAPPPPVPWKVDGPSEDLAKALIFGITTVEQICEKCGELRTVEIRGDARVEPD